GPHAMNVESQPGRPKFSDLDGELAVNNIAELLGNIEATIFVLDEALKSVAPNKAQLHPEMFVHVMRMCLSWLIISLAKVNELWGRYGAFASDGTTDKMRAVV